MGWPVINAQVIQIILGIKGGAWLDRVVMHILILAILSYFGCFGEDEKDK